MGHAIPVWTDYTAGEVRRFAQRAKDAEVYAPVPPTIKGPNQPTSLVRSAPNARQRGTKWHPGTNVGLAKDHTLFALINGRVEFRTKAKGRVFVSVQPMTEAAAE